VLILGRIETSASEWVLRLEFLHRSSNPANPVYSRTQAERLPPNAVQKWLAQMRLGSVTHVLCEETVEFLLAILHAHSIARVHNPNKGIRLLEVVSPIRPQGSLATNIPYSRIVSIPETGDERGCVHIFSVYLTALIMVDFGTERLPSVGERLDVEPEGRADSTNVLAADFLEDGGFPSIVQATGTGSNVCYRRN